MLLLTTIGLAAIITAHDQARSRWCPCCARRYAVYPVFGRLRRWMLVCWPCFRSHRRRRRAMAR